MRKIAALFLCMVFLLPVLSLADCQSDTKTCDDTKAAAHRCAQTFGFRAEVACADWNKAVKNACAQAQKSCGGETEVSSPSPSRNHNLRQSRRFGKP